MYSMLYGTCATFEIRDQLRSGTYSQMTGTTHLTVESMVPDLNSSPISRVTIVEIRDIRVSPEVQPTLNLLPRVSPIFQPRLN